jgi:methanogenic corrinoid protein MtbC1
VNGNADLRMARLGVLSALIEGDAATAFRLALELLGEGIPFEVVLLDVIAPVQAELGHRWVGGDYRIAEEHAATGGVETLVSLLAGSLEPEPGAGRVVVASAEGDTHALPGRMATALLINRGWRATYLGATLPAADLGGYLDDVRPDALVLSCAMVTWLRGARGCIAAAHGAGVPVLAGGSGFGQDAGLAKAVGADGWASSLGGIDDVLRTWSPDPAAAEAAVAPEPGLLADLDEHRPAIIAAAVAAAGLRGRLPVRRLTADLDLLIGALEASLLTGRADLLADFAAWQERLLGSHIGDGLVPALLDGLGGALVALVPEAVPTVDEARALLSAG